jgi:hypothetical protein
MGILIPVVIVVISILVIRFFGAWMFRIDVVIDELKKINKQLNK